MIATQLKFDSKEIKDLTKKKCILKIIQDTRSIKS